jgi:hypothetical protein
MWTTAASDSRAMRVTSPWAMTGLEQRTQLAAQIREAFDGVHRPPEALIAPHECDDCAAVRAAFAPFEWSNLPWMLIELYPCELNLLGPEAYVYYLPAYMLYALAHFTPYDIVTEMTVHALAPTADQEGPTDSFGHACERLRHFTRGQIEAAAAFVGLAQADAIFTRYTGDLEPRRLRLLRFWEQRWD